MARAREAAARGAPLLGVADHDFADTVGVFVLFEASGEAYADVIRRDDVAHVARAFGAVRVVVTRDAAVARECRAAGLAVAVRRAAFARPLVACARDLCGEAAAGGWVRVWKGLL